MSDPPTAPLQNFYGVVGQPLTQDYLARQLPIFQPKVPNSQVIVAAWGRGLGHRAIKFDLMNPRTFSWLLFCCTVWLAFCNGVLCSCSINRAAGHLISWPWSPMHIHVKAIFANFFFGLAPACVKLSKLRVAMSKTTSTLNGSPWAVETSYFSVFLLTSSWQWRCICYCSILTHTSPVVTISHL